MPLTLRPYQVTAVQKLRDKVREGRRLLVLIAPTGSGKTVVAAEIIRAAVARGSRCLFLAHRRELIDQTLDKLQNFCGLDAGVIMGTDKRADELLPIQVASVQTLVNRTLPVAQVVVVDECHHALSSSYLKIIKAYPNAVILGLTATPWRLDKLGLADVFEDHVVAATVQELLDQGHLIQHDCFAYDSPDLHNVKTTNGDYNQKDLGLACNTKVLVGSIVKEYLEHAKGRRTLLYPVDINHSEALVRGFTAAGVSAAHLDCNTPKARREEIVRGLADGTITIVSSVGVLTEGFDCLDEQTEILTSNGWRGIGQVNVGDLVYSLNRASGVGELVHAERVVERLVVEGERMVTLRSQHVNIRTTEGHEFHVKYRDPGQSGHLSTNFITRTGAQLVARRSAYALPISTRISFPGVALSDDELRLIAWFMTDGGFEGSAFCISQAKSYRDEIRALLVRLGLDFGERVRQPGRGAFANAKPLHVFRIPKGNQTGKQARCGWVKYAAYLDKDVSPLLHAMSREQFRVFWEELLKGDGTKQGNKAGWLWCDRKSQADAYTQLAVVRGFSASFSVQTTKAKHAMFVVSVRDTQWITSDPGDERAAKIAFDTPRPGERVWCVTNRNSTLITRREGKIAVLGNCPAAEICILARPTKSLSLHLQMIGRVLRPSPGTGKLRALIHDHSGNLLRHGLPAEDRDYSLGATPKRVKDLCTCAQCGFVGKYEKDGTCKQCGFLMQPPEEQKEPRGAKKDKDVVDGYRISAEEILEIRKRGIRSDLTDRQIARAKNATISQKAAEYKRLLEVAKRKGFKKGFAAHKYKETFAVWPRFSEELLAATAAATRPFFELPKTERAERPRTPPPPRQAPLPFTPKTKYELAAELLGVPLGATEEDIRVAYRAKVKVELERGGFGDQGDAVDVTIAINSAKSLLIEKARKRATA